MAAASTTGTISVVIPTYNAARFLADAVASVRAQTRAPVEIIVVDDGSVDGTPALAAGLGVRCLATPRNSGPSLARNIGIEAAAGEYVAFLDADDWWEPRHLELTARLLDVHAAAVVAFGDTRNRTARDDGAAPPDASVMAGHAFAPRVPTAALRPLVTENRLIQSAAVVRRTALLAVGGYFTGLRHAEDYDLWLRLAARPGAQFVRSGEVTLNYRVHAAQATNATVAMLTGWWTARIRLAESVAREEPELTESLRVLLAAAWAADARWAWRSGDGELMRAVLGFHERIPGADAPPWRWRVRTRWLWPAWRRAVRAWDALPPPARAALNRVRGR